MMATDERSEASQAPQDEQPEEELEEIRQPATTWQNYARMIVLQLMSHDGPMQYATLMVPICYRKEIIAWADEQKLHIVGNAVCGREHEVSEFTVWRERPIEEPEAWKQAAKPKKVWKRYGWEK